MQLDKTRRFSQEMVKRAYRQLVLEEEKVKQIRDGGEHFFPVIFIKSRNFFDISNYDCLKYLLTFCNIRGHRF